MAENVNGESTSGSDGTTGVSRRTLMGGALVAGGVGLLSAAPAEAAPAATGPAVLSASAEARVSALLARMTVAEKLGQLRLSGDPETATKALRTTGLGGIFSVVGSSRINALQRIAVERTRLKIPLLVGLDVIHGYVTNFPIPLAQASSFDPDVAASDARVSATEARRSGIAWTFAPMMDVTHEPRWGRIAEGNGEDPYLTSRLAAAKVRAYQGDDLARDDTLAACAKHYVGYGGSEGGRDYNTVDVSVQRLHNHYLPRFRAAVDAGVATVMTSFNTVNGVPVHGNESLVRGVLKSALGFGGMVVSDYTGVQELIVHGLARDEPEAAAAALGAGVDMEMVSTTYVEFGQQLLRSGRLSAAHLDDAVRRVLRLKVALGLFENPYTDPRTEVKAPTASTRAAARHAAGRSMVLLKNDGTLPLARSTRRIALVGPLAEATTDLNGTWAGLAPGAQDTKPVTVLDGLRRALPGTTISVTPGCAVLGTDTTGFAAAQAAARDADVVVAVVGETAALSGEASARADIGLPGVQEQLVTALASTGKPVVVVLLNGRPLTLTAVDAAASAVLEAWAPGVEGGNAVADVLTGAVNPGGKLPSTFPRSVGQVPLYYNHERTGRPADARNKYTSKYLDEKITPLYEFGHGLSYTTFALSGVSLSSRRMAASGGSVVVKATVRNTGGRAGDEVVQVYLRDPAASIVQPVRRLRGFQRVTLAAGASRTLSFTLTPADVGFYDSAAQFLVERGLIQIFVGTSSSAPQAGSFDVV